MKTSNNILKLTLSVFFMATTIVVANNNDPIKKESKKASAEVVNLESTVELNREYISEVHLNSTREEEKYLSGIVSAYDIRNSEQFQVNKNITLIDSREKEYDLKMHFKSENGYAIAHYGDDGKIVAVQKRFKNIELPAEIQEELAENYEGWKVVKNRYDVSYEVGQEVEKSYVLNMKNGKEKKKIRMKG